MRRLIAALVLLIAPVAFAQVPPVSKKTSDPSGQACTSVFPLLYVNATGTLTWYCCNGSSVYAACSEANTAALATALAANGSNCSAGQYPLGVDASGAVESCTASPTAANPTSSIGLTASNGSAATFLRSDASQALSQAISPTWTGAHLFDSNLTMNYNASPHRAISYLAEDETGIGDFWSYVTVGENTSHPEGAAIDDSVWRYISYNLGTANAQVVSGEHAAWCQLEATWSPDGVQEYVEHNCDYRAPEGGTSNGDGDGSFRWYISEVIVRGYCSSTTTTSCRTDGDCPGGETCTNDDTAVHKWGSFDDADNPAGSHLEIGSTGKIKFSAGLTGAHYEGGFCAGSTGGADNDGTQCDVDGDCTGTSAACYFEDTADTSHGADFRRTMYVRTNKTASPRSFSSVFMDSIFDSTTTDSQITDWAGIRFDMTWSGSTTGRDVGTWFGARIVPSITQTGASSTLNTFKGYDMAWSALFSGQNVTSQLITGSYIESPAALGSGSAVTTLVGHWISDLDGIGTNNAAVFVDSQTGGSATKGNVYMGGGNYTSGHFQLAGAHIWFDGTSLRGKASAPSSASDGAVIGGPPTTHAGGMIWGDSDDTTDTGTEVCTLAGLTCVDVKLPNGTDSDCSTDQGTAGTYFYALCRKT